MSTSPYRQQQARLTATLDNVNLGVWDNMTGGDSDSNSTQYFLGGMGPQVSLGGVLAVSNVVLSVLQTQHVNRKWIRSRVGKGRVVINQQALDDEGDPFGEPDTWTGILKRAKSSDIDAQSNNAKMFELEAEIDSPVA